MQTGLEQAGLVFAALELLTQAFSETVKSYEFIKSSLDKQKSLTRSKRCLETSKIILQRFLYIVIENVYNDGGCTARRMLSDGTKTEFWQSETLNRKIEEKLGDAAWVEFRELLKNIAKELRGKMDLINQASSGRISAELMKTAKQTLDRLHAPSERALFEVIRSGQDASRILDLTVKIEGLLGRPEDSDDSDGWLATQARS